MSEIAFIPVRPTEAASIETLARDIWPRVYSDMISASQIDYMLGWMYDSEKIEKEINREGIVYLFIEREGKKIGFLAFGPVVPSKPCFIHKIYVAPEFHRQGIGTHAIAEIETRATKGRANHLELRVNRTNQRAIALYERTGFEIAREDCADIGNGFVMDDYIFQKAISATERSLIG